MLRTLNHMTISVCICSRNRSPILRETLISVYKSIETIKFDVELIVVDNHSTDDTAAVVRSTTSGWRNIRFLKAEPLGLCYARNLAVRHAIGDIIVFTDDDVRVPTDWIVEITRPIREAKADLVQGGIVPADHLVRPWLSGALKAVSANVQLSHGSQPPTIVGANFAFSRRVLDVVRGFDVIFGPGRCGFSDDTLFGLMAMRAGFRAVYTDRATVVHHFPEDRLDAPSVLGVARKLGRSRALLEFHWKGVHPLSTIPQMIVNFVRLNSRLVRQTRADAGVPEWRFCHERDWAYSVTMLGLVGSRARYQPFAVGAILE